MSQSSERVDGRAAVDVSPGGVGGAELLGSVRLLGPDGAVAAITRPQVQVALAFLLVERRPVGRGELAELLWGDRPLADHWQGAVRGVLSKLRDHLAEAGIDGGIASPRDGTVRLVVPEGFAVDLDLARLAIDAAERSLDEGDPASAAEQVASWTSRLTQPLLPAGDGDWVRAEQQRVAELSRRAATVHATALLSTGRPDLAAETAQTWVRLHPLDEALHEILIRALLASGRRRDAIDAHDRLARILADELGIGPAAATTALLADGHAERSPKGPPISGIDAGASPPVRSQGGGGDGGIFLGRQAELDALVAAWQRTTAERRPHLVEISGRSGIGKTRLADELCAVAAESGARVRWARCLPGASLAFEPLASAVRDSGAGARTAASSGPTDPATARAEALRAIDDGMRALAAAPAVLVVDDLQWASDDLAVALEQTLVDLSGPLLVIVTSRSLRPGLHELLSRLGRALPTTTLRLRGLEAAELRPLFGPGSGDDLATELHRRTGGHPFFVSEMAIAPWRAGRPIDLTEVPDGIRDWIGHRADALPKPVRARLDLAAVMGDTCRVATIARCAHVPQDQVLDELDVLVDEGFMVETGRVDEFTFAHLITRDAIYERIGPTRRARLHAAVAEAVAAAPPHVGQAAEVARHLREAGPERAVEAGRMLLVAGREALDAGAWAVAEQHYRDAGAAAPDEPDIRAGALTGIAQAFHLQRRRTEAEDLVNDVLAIARAHRLPLELAEAVLVLVGRAGRGATERLTDLEQAALLREALDGLAELEARDPIDPAALVGEPQRHAELVRRETLACRVEGELALALALTASPAERNWLAQRAVARARSLHPADTRLTARALLISRLARIEPHQVRQRLADLDQVLAIAPSGRSVDATLAAHTYRHEDLLTCGEREASRAALAEAIDLAERSQHPYWSWATAVWLGLDALIDGDLDLAEERAVAAAALQGSEGGAQACLGVNLVNIRLYQGRSGEVLDLLAAAAEASPHIPCYRAVHALCAVEAGEEAAATASYERFRSSGFAAIPHDTNRLLALVVLADAAVQLGDAEGAPLLRDLLAPAGHLNALLNCYGGGGAFWGPVAHQLARLESLLGNRAEADAWFAVAEATARATGAPLALARVVGDPVRSAIG